MKNILQKTLAPCTLALAVAGAHAQAAPIGFATLNGGTTGGAGGDVVYATTGTEIHAALCNRASSDTPVIIHVEGNINHGNTSKVSGDSCNTADDKIEIKEVSNISIIGVGNGAVFDELGIHLRGAENIILQNLHVRNVKKSGSPTSNGGDAIGMESDVYNVWADHLTLEAQGGESSGYDALFDMKADTKYVTLSYSTLRNSGRGGLVGSSDGDTNNGPVTFHHNLYENIDSRTPLLRGATAHAYNNHYIGLQKSGMNPRIGGEIKAENNYFEDSKDPIGTFYTNDMGYWDVSGNIFDNVTWTEDDDDNHPAGPNPVSTIYISIPYSYQADSASCVPDIVAATAGAYTGLAVSDGSCEVSSSSSSEQSSSSESSASSESSSSEAPTEQTLIFQESDGFCGVEGSIDSDNAGFTGDGFANTENATGTGIDWSVEVPESGEYTLSWRYANGSSNRPAAIMVNNNTQANIDMDSSGAWTNYIDSNTISVYLDAGYSELRLQATGSGGLANIDQFSITGQTPSFGNCAGGSSSSSSSSVSSAPSSSSSSSSSSEDQELVLGANLALNGGSDGSSKGNGTSYGNVRDGDLSSYWQPSSASGEEIAVKGLSGAFNTVIIRELNGATSAWRLINHDTGEQLASGSNLSNDYVISGFGSVSADKVELIIDSASSAPQIAEFEVYNATGGNGESSSSSSEASSTSSEETSSSEQSSSSSSAVSSSSSSEDSSSSSSSVTPPPETDLSADCVAIATDPNVNWRSTSLQTDQEIVECLSNSLGRAVGYGENALGGYDPNGNSTLTVITKNSATSVEQQLLDAVTGDAHNWIVFDKFDFANETEISMHRIHCANPDVLSAIGGTEAQCNDYHQWCDDKGISDDNCAAEFYNDRLNDNDLPIRNTKIGSHKTLDGRMSNGYFRFNGFAIGSDSSGQPVQTAESVILNHLDFRGAGHTEDHGLDPDMIRNTGASHDIWIHKNTFNTTGDAAFDVKVGAYDITISFNKLINVKRASLHGSSDSRTINEQITTTLHHNAFITTDDHYDSLGNTLRRVPLIRRGASHMFENFFMNYRKDILSVRVGATVLWEDNMVLMNRDFQEKDDVVHALEERGEELARDVDGGNFRSENTRVWFSDAACNLDPSLEYLITDASGSVPDLKQDYSQASRDAISDNYLGAGQQLADYVSATAGKNGARAFNSPLGYEPWYVLGLGKVACQ